ncbi:unnamed protein product [Cylindrotheca closterium]|uniref:Uncharacterized protein n=1 Tax=Cylindrotheca closterium TaxID=2856 RepID=A0AAD2GD51_9STRA|nr:unnamed protein product [Cylindrotheca closterium]
MKLKVANPAKLKALVKNGKTKALKMKQESTKALIKVLPKSTVPRNGEKRDYDTDSSSQDHMPLLPDSEGSSTTDEEEESHNSSGGDHENFAQFSTTPTITLQDHELPIATPIIESPPSSPQTTNRNCQIQRARKERQVQKARQERQVKDLQSPQKTNCNREIERARRERQAQQARQARRQVQPARQEPPASIKVNVNSHRSRAFYAASKNPDANSVTTNKEGMAFDIANLTCQMSQFPSDISGVSDDAVLPPSDAMADAKLVSKTAFLKAVQVSGAMLETGNTLCVASYEHSLKEVDAVPCITKAPGSIEQGAKMEIISTTSQTTSGSSAASILEAQEEEEEADYPDDEGPVVVVKPLQKSTDLKRDRRRNRRHPKEKTRAKGKIADPNAADDDDFFLMTAEDVEEITKMARELANTNSSDGEEGGTFGCHLAKDVVEWLLCTSIQGGGRHTMTKKQAKTWFADQDMEDGQSSMRTPTMWTADTKFVDEDMPPSPKRSVRDELKSASKEFENSDNSVIEENEDSDSDSDFDDGEDFYFDEQSMTSANKVVRQFRPTGLICTDNLAVVYGGNLEQLEGTIETVLVVDDKQYDENSDKQMDLEQHDCECDGDLLPVYVPSCPEDDMEDVICADGPIPNFDERKLNYDYQNYQIGINSDTVTGTMELDAIVCEGNEGDEKCWDTLSNITPLTVTSHHTALHRRLQELETELVRLQVEYQDISGSSDEGVMEEFQNEPTDDSSIDGLPQTSNDASQSGGDNNSVRKNALQAKLSTMKMLQEEKTILERRVQELVSMMEASELCHSKQMAETKKASDAKLEELRYHQKSALDEAASKIQELESSLVFSHTKMADIRAKYSHDLEAAKISQSSELEEIQRQQKPALDAAKSKIEELESSLYKSQTKLEELKERYSRDLEALEREQMYKARERDLIENDLRSSLNEAEYKAEKDRDESERMVREIRDEHTKQIEEMIQQLDVVVAQHEKEHAKEFEKLIAQLDLVVAEHEKKTMEMDTLVQEKNSLIANLGSQLATAQMRLIQIDGSS